MALSQDMLKVASRRAYERGRLWSALGVLVYVVPATVVAAALTFSSLHAWIAGAVLAVVAIGLTFRGEVYAKAVGPGLTAGLLSAVIAIGMCHFGFCDPVTGPALCGALCLIGGAISGVLVVRRAQRLDVRRRAFVLSSATVAFLAGALGCTMLGVFGVLGLGLGVALSAIPLGLIYASESSRS